MSILGQYLVLSPTTADFSKFLLEHLVYEGPHPVYGEEGGRQVAFDFGWCRVSISQTPFTQGVEMFVWGLFYRPIRNLTPEVAARVLLRIVERSL